ncbi:lipopolysaccharide assembly protein LapB [uncultured Methanobrevibacter sp.]|uniref:tetratricopeptide repeat protein n=1 Tax=uncultured Methanobrevibacter sp. TaxID=253161 RepID=UPI002611321E|nr:peptide transporter [uncultured Methanobrevibacter sp.]
MVNKKAIELINNKEYEKANKLSFRLFQKKNLNDFLEINDLLLKENYIPAIPLRGYYYLIEDITHDNQDYGEKYFNKYLEKRPDSISIRFQKAVALSAKGKEEESKQIIENLIENYHENPYNDEIITCKSKENLCELKLIYLFEKELKEEALNYGEEILKEYPNNMLTLLAKAKLLCEKNENNEEALEIINRCLKIEKTIEGLLIKGDIYVNLKEYKKAIQCFDMGINALSKTEEPLILEWYHKKALALIQLQEYNEAMKCLNRTMDIILSIEINNDLNENGIKLLKDCEKEKQKLLNQGIADVKYSKHNFDLNKLVYIMLALAIIVRFLPVNSKIELIVVMLFLITAVASLAKKIYENNFI